MLSINEDGSISALVSSKVIHKNYTRVTDTIAHKLLLHHTSVDKTLNICNSIKNTHASLNNLNVLNRVTFTKTYIMLVKGNPGVICSH